MKCFRLFFVAVSMASRLLGNKTVEASGTLRTLQRNPPPTTGIPQRLRALEEIVMTLNAEIQCLQSATYSIDAMGDLIRTDCTRTQNTNLGTVVGPQGIQGEKGETGEIGPQGEKGDIGETGHQGEKGDTGDQGPEGIQGPQGDPGTDGIDGIDGNDGVDGINGNDGFSCTVDANMDGIADRNADDTGTILTCQDGTMAIIPDGIDGTDGVNGLAGTSCTVDADNDGVADRNSDDTGTVITCTDNSSVLIPDGIDGAAEEDIDEDALFSNFCSNLNMDGERLLDGCFKRVFVTSGSWKGDLGGLEGADQKCAEHAISAGLPGTFYAWLATNSTNDPKHRFTQSAVPYYTTRNDLLAKNWDEFTDGHVDNFYYIDENGEIPDDGHSVAFSCTDSDGTFREQANEHCNGYTVDDNSARTGFLYIDGSETGLRPTAAGNCNVQSHILCVQQ